MSDPVKPNKERVIVNSTEAVPLIYVNDVSIEAAPWDIKSRFATVVSVSDTAVRVREVAHAVMSPQYAKAYLACLADQVAAYERVYGPIPGILPAK